MEFEEIESLSRWMKLGQSFLQKTMLTRSEVDIKGIQKCRSNLPSFLNQPQLRR